MEHWLSIVIPAYRAERSIERCLHSLELIYSCAKEIIIIDDGSNDSTALAARRYKGRLGSKVIVIENKTNKGPSYSRNIGIRNASGSHVMFVDADDMVSEHICQSILEEASRYAFTGFHHYQGRDVGGNSECRLRNNGGYCSDESLLLQGDQLEKFLCRYLMEPRAYCLLEHCWAKLYDLRLIRSHEVLFDQDMEQLEDVLFNLRVLAITRKVYIVPVPAYIHILDSSDNRLSLRAGSKSRTIQDVTRCAEAVSNIVEGGIERRLVQAYRASKLTSYLIRLNRIETRESFYRILFDYKRDRLWKYSVVAADESAFLQVLLSFRLSGSLIGGYILFRKKYRQLLPKRAWAVLSGNSRTFLEWLQGSG